MPKVIVTARVRDVTRWEQRFRTHGALFKSQTVTTPIGIAVREDKTVAICAEPADLDEFMRILESAATEEAMANDGVERDTVEVYSHGRRISAVVCCGIDGSAALGVISRMSVGLERQSCCSY